LPHGAFRARRRPNPIQVSPARANAPARGLSVRETGFAPEMTRYDSGLPRILFMSVAKTM
jgi:hypothetical protein